MDIWYKGYADGYDWVESGNRENYFFTGKNAEYAPNKLYPMSEKWSKEQKTLYLSGWNVAMEENTNVVQNVVK